MLRSQRRDKIMGGAAACLLLLAAACAVSSAAAAAASPSSQVRGLGPLLGGSQQWHCAAPPPPTTADPTPANHPPTNTATQRAELLKRRASSRDGVITFTSADFDRLAARPPRDYHLVFFINAAHLASNQQMKLPALRSEYGLMSQVGVEGGRVVGSGSGQEQWTLSAGLAGWLASCHRAHAAPTHQPTPHRP
jgi:hypothetical protein